MLLYHMLDFGVHVVDGCVDLVVEVGDLVEGFLCLDGGVEWGC